MAGVKVSEYTELASLVGDEKIPTGTGVRKATTPDQLKAFIGNSASKLTDLTDVDAGAAGSADGKFLTELAPVAGERQFGFVDATVAAGDVVGLQAELDTKEATIVAATTSDYLRGDKTFQPLNKSVVGLSNVDNTTDLNKPISTLTQTALDTKLSNLTSPAATGAALSMAESGTNGQLKKLIAGQDINFVEAVDSVTLATTGRTLKDFVEVSETVSSRFYRYFVPNISPTGTAATNIRLVGRQGTAGSNYSFSLIDATSNLKPNTGAGSVDLQIVRDAVGQTASGADNYVAGKRITVQGRNCIVLDATDTTKSVSGNNNVVIGLKHITDGSSGTSTVSGGENTAINVLTIFGAVTGNQNALIGSGGASGNNNTALGTSAGGSTGNGGLTLCHSTGNPIGGNRGMSGALTRGTANNLVNHQIIEMYYTATTSAYTSGTWSNLTWDGLVAGTTNVYSAPAVGTVVISGYVSVGGTTTGRLFKVEAILMNGSLSQTITFVAGYPDPAYGSVQLVKSGNYIYVQIKQDGDLTILGKATLSFTEF